VGTVKTGSTSLQAYLVQHQHALTEAGWCYLPSPGRPDRRDLAAACIALEDQRDELLRSLDIAEPQRRLAYRQQVCEQLARQLKALPQDLGVILSSEHFHLSLQRPEEIRTLRQLLLGLGLEVEKVVIYLREPLSLIESLFSTMVRSGDQRPLPADPADPFVQLICDHPATLHRWRQVFGAATVQARAFPPRAGQSLSADFLQLLDSAPAAGWPPEFQRQRNRGLNPQALKLLAWLNSHCPWLTPQARWGWQRGLRRLLDGALSRWASGAYRMPQPQRSRYAQRFSDSYQALLEQEAAQ
jgi:hypothetical protein